MSKVWSSEQQALIDVNENGFPTLTNIAVRADAGSGKTSTLVERIRRMYEKNQKLKVLCVSFTEKSSADLKDRLNPFSNCEVYTIHGFCMKVIKEFGNLLGIAPVLKILNQEKADELFTESFLKIFKRIPLDQSEMSYAQYNDLFKNIIQNIENNQFPKIEWENHDSKIITDFALELWNEYQNAKTKMNAIEFQDQENLCLEILQNPKAASQISNRYDFIFIDEFQDTNRIQCEIINRIVKNQDKIYVVGDEKQSIYRFRGAEVEVFNDFANQRKNKTYLTKNYRSEKPILDLVNKVCSPIIQNYRDMIADISMSSVKENIIHICEDKNNESRILNAIQAALNNGHDLSEIVILLRRFTSIRSIANVLSQNSIPFVSTSSTQIKNDPVIRSFAKMWRWAFDPNQNYFASQCLASFNEETSLKNIQNLKDFHDEKIIQLNHPLEILMQLDQRFKCSLHYGVKFDEFKQFILSEFIQGINSHEIAQELHRLLEHDTDVSNLVSSPPPPQMKGIVRIMTVHAAKGLEFPAVVLTDLSFKQTNRDPFITQKHNKTIIRARDEDGKLSTSWSSYLDLKEKETLKEEQESARVLYVAMTRAQKTLIFVTDPPKENNSKKSGQTWNDWVYPHLPKPKQIDFIQQKSVIKEVISVAKAQLENEKPQYHKARVGVTEYLKNIKSNETQINENVSQKAEKKSEKDFTEIGTIVHQFIQFHQFNELWDYAKAQNLNLNAFKNWIQNTKESEIIFKETDTKRIFNEFLFEYSTNSTVLTGRIDRIVQTEKDIWIVDYKTIFRKVSSDAFKNEYSNQLDLYAKAISKLFLNNNFKFRKVLIDLTCATGQIFHELN